MKSIFDFEISEEIKNEVAENLNSQSLFMNPRTGTVQSIELWKLEHDESFYESELVKVKLFNDKWVKVN